MTQLTKRSKQRGSVLALVVVAVIILTLTGAALLKTAEGQWLQATRVKNQESAFSAAEAAYENAAFWMSRQPDMLDAVKGGAVTGALTFPQSKADYSIAFSSFLGARPVYLITATGTSGIYERTIKSYVVQAVSGWEMGLCRVPTGPNTTAEVMFVNGEVIDLPIHINDRKDSPDSRDIYISGSPSFLSHISMGEARKTSGGTDKYASVMSLFKAGISFSQPASRILDKATVDKKIDRFKNSTSLSYRFKPTAKSLPKHAQGKTGFYNTVSAEPAVHLKFYIKDGHGYVRIYNNCTVAAYTRGGTSSNSYDYKINPANTATYMKYPIYGCHFTDGSFVDVRTDDPASALYVTQDFGGVQSDPGGQIYVDGNVIIGCRQEDIAAMAATINRVKGRITVVASGNIWMTHELMVDGNRQGNEMPTLDNPNIVGLIAQGVIKIVDPGMTTNEMLYNTSFYNPTKVTDYMPVGNTDGALLYSRKLPYTMTVEASMTIGGGGWGAENVYRSSSFIRRKTFYSNKNDILIVRGSLAESIRSPVASGKNGFLKHYYYDKRVMTGILPGNIWLKGKYVLIPGGWTESSSLKTKN